MRNALQAPATHTVLTTQGVLISVKCPGANTDDADSWKADPRAKADTRYAPSQFWQTQGSSMPILLLFHLNREDKRPA